MNEREIFTAALKLSHQGRAKFLELARKDNAALRKTPTGCRNVRN